MLGFRANHAFLQIGNPGLSWLLMSDTTPMGRQKHPLLNQTSINVCLFIFSVSSTSSYYRVEIIDVCRDNI